MKKTKTFLSVILAVIIAASFSVVSFAANITEADAKRIALEKAGFTESEVSYIMVKQDWDNGVQVFEVEFLKGLNEYDFDISVATGEIISMDSDAPDFVIEGKEA